MNDAYKEFLSFHKKGFSQTVFYPTPHHLRTQNSGNDWHVDFHIPGHGVLGEVHLVQMANNELNEEQFIGVILPSPNMSKATTLERTILNRLPLGVAAINDEERILYVNKYLESRSGYSIQELRSKDASLFLPDNQRLYAQDLIRRARNNSVEAKLPLIRKDVSVVMCEIFLVYELGHKNAESVFIAFIRDASHQSKEEHFIRAIKQQLYDAHQSIGDLLQNLSEEEDEVKKIHLNDLQITEREQSVLFETLRQKTAGEVAESLGVAEITVRKHLSSLYKKFQVNGKQELLLLLHDKVLV
ncbi:MAG: LuxR C-terminal-related transcriptional regulator [Spirochaetales bacterium]|nr:LuxR C-terminal-related transcriptional regulator [Spirochaetales bacterium]